jgi:hypothetical protein
LKKAKKVANNGHFKTAIAVGMFLFCVFGLFAYSFYCGSVLVIKKFPNNIKITTKSGKFEIHHEKD